MHAANQVIDGTSNPVDVSAGVLADAEVTGPTVKFTKEGTYYWVETVHVEQGGQQIVLHTGKCGQPGETTVVKKPPFGLAITGTNGVYATLILGGSLLLLGLLVLALMIRRRRTSSAATD